MSCFFYGTLMSDAVLTSVLCRSSGPKGQIAAKLATLRFRPAVIKVGIKDIASRRVNDQSTIVIDYSVS